MLSTKNLIVHESQVPSYWVFQYYLGLTTPLTGQREKIRSVFNPSEKTPSMYIYVDKSVMQYKFKDFSTGKQGSKIDLVMLLFQITYGEAVSKLIDDYNTFIKKNGTSSVVLKPEENWTVSYYSERSWFQHDAKFWLSFNIGSKILKEHNVRPIEYYEMTKGSERIKIKSDYIYGYFTKYGEIYKIYQPYNRKKKFLKISSYVQGIDQLKYNQPYLVICSSLKDAMCLKSIGYNVEAIAPDSENSILKPLIVNHLLQKYKRVVTLFDNDEAGIKAITRYNEVYGIDGSFLSLDKDISDAVKNFGLQKTHEHLKPLLKSILKLET
jgi:hypothetical protein